MIRQIITKKLLVLITLCILLLLHGLWPGSLDTLSWFLIYSFILWGSLLVVMAVRSAISIFRYYRTDPSRAKFIFIRSILAVGILLGTFILVLDNIPVRASFLMFIKSFERRLPLESSVTNGLDSKEQWRQQYVGIWHVDERMIDSRGGIYFRIGKSMDGISPDQMSFGFVYQPNREGSPFGNAKYECYRITRKWYFFHASDDF